MRPRSSTCILRRQRWRRWEFKHWRFLQPSRHATRRDVGCDNQVCGCQLQFKQHRRFALGHCNAGEKTVECVDGGYRYDVSYGYLQEWRKGAVVCPGPNFDVAESHCTVKKGSLPSIGCPSSTSPEKAKDAAEKKAHDNAAKNTTYPTDNRLSLGLRTRRRREATRPDTQRVRCRRLVNKCRVMLSSQMLWPNSCSCCVAFFIFSSPA